MTIREHSKTSQKLLYLKITEHQVANGEGWMLSLRQTLCPERWSSSKPALLLVPGYGMNSFIFSYHPKGMSLERVLAEAGFEVWSVDLRAQGKSEPLEKNPSPPSLEALAIEDLNAATAFVISYGQSQGLVLIGCSLGGSLSYANWVFNPLQKEIVGLIAVGSPLIWKTIPAFVKWTMFSPKWIGRIPIFGARTMAKHLFPILVRRFSKPLEIYMNPSHVDFSAFDQMVETVENPHPKMNREIATWIQNKDLILRGLSISKSLNQAEIPLLVVTSNRDGIVKPETALSVKAYWSGPLETLEVGNEDNWYAHADLFIADTAPRDFFQPMIHWLNQHYA